MNTCLLQPHPQLSHRPGPGSRARIQYLSQKASEAIDVDQHPPGHSQSMRVICSTSDTRTKYPATSQTHQAVQGRHQSLGQGSASVRHCGIQSLLHHSRLQPALHKGQPIGRLPQLHGAATQQQRQPRRWPLPAQHQWTVQPQLKDDGGMPSIPNGLQDGGVLDQRHGHMVRQDQVNAGRRQMGRSVHVLERPWYLTEQGPVDIHPGCCRPQKLPKQRAHRAPRARVAQEVPGWIS